MNRRTFLLSLAASPLLVEMLTACSSLPSLPGGASGGKGLVRSDQSRVTGTEPAVAADATNRFGADMLAHLQRAAPNDNLVFSPLSIAVALAMTVAGAEGATRDEMATVLGYDRGARYGSDSSVESFLATYFPSMNALLTSLMERQRDRPEVELDLANAVWGQHGYVWNAQFLDVLAKQFGTGIETVDFEADTGGARSTINNWVKQQTHDRVPELLGKDALTTLTRLVLVNAVYLKADWDSTFDANDTYDREFTTAAGDTVEVPMMYRSDDITYGTGDGWKAVELPYIFGELRLVAVVADDASVTLPAIDEVTASLKSGPVFLSFPRFDFETKTSLKEALEQLGMPTAFSDTADFTGMTDTGPLKIGDVIHQANITTGEKGTEAAAATAVEMKETMAPPPDGDEIKPIKIVFDRPFTFWLRDEPTGATIFAGRVNDPSK